MNNFEDEVVRDLITISKMSIKNSSEITNAMLTKNYHLGEEKDVSFFLLLLCLLHSCHLSAQGPLCPSASPGRITR